MRSYREPLYDDTVCACGRKLPETVEPYTWEDNGFCSVACAIACNAPFRVRGTKPSLELARMNGGRGPGFEDSLLAIAERNAAEVPDGTGLLALDKLRSEDDARVPRLGSWAWRLYHTDQRGTFNLCSAFRLTARKETTTK